MFRLHRTTCVCVAVLWAVAGEAQIEAHRYRFGASVGAMAFEAMEADDRSVHIREFSLAPRGGLRLGYTLTEAWEAGLLGGVSRLEIEVESRKYTATVWRLGPYVEYNVPWEETKKWILAPGALFAWTGADGTLLDSDGFEVGVSLWVKRFIGQHASVEFGVTLTYFNGEVGNPTRVVYDEDLDTTSIRVTPQIAISVWP